MPENTSVKNDQLWNPNDPMWSAPPQTGVDWKSLSIPGT